MEQDVQKKAVVFLDLDGTLWDREVIPASAWQAIRKARQNGHRIFINTGRKRDNIPEILWKGGFDGFGLATGMDLIADGKPIQTTWLNKEKALKMRDYLISCHSGYSLEGVDVNYDDPKYAFRRQVFLDKEQRPEFMNRKPLSQMPVSALDHLVKLSFDTEIPFQDLEQKAEELGFDILYYRSRYNPLNGFGSLYRGELTEKSVNKATAMRTMLQAMHLNPDDFTIIAIGDSENDIPMMQAADIGICMGNGNEQAKAAADYITKPLQEDGLACAFDHFGLLK